MAVVEMIEVCPLIEFKILLLLDDQAPSYLKVL